MLPSGVLVNSVVALFEILLWDLWIAEYLQEQLKINRSVNNLIKFYLNNTRWCKFFGFTG